jgi:hypothetical protein
VLAIADAVANGIANALLVHDSGLEKWLREGISIRYCSQ